MSKEKKRALKAIAEAMEEIKRNLELDANDDSALAQSEAMYKLANAFRLVAYRKN